MNSLKDFPNARMPGSRQGRLADMALSRNTEDTDEVLCRLQKRSPLPLTLRMWLIVWKMYARRVLRRKWATLRDWRPGPRVNCFLPFLWLIVLILAMTWSRSLK